MASSEHLPHRSFEPGEALLGAIPSRSYLGAGHLTNFPWQKPGPPCSRLAVQLGNRTCTTTVAVANKTALLMVQTDTACIQRRALFFHFLLSIYTLYKPKRFYLPWKKIENTASPATGPRFQRAERQVKKRCRAPQLAVSLLTSTFMKPFFSLVRPITRK